MDVKRMFSPGDMTLVVVIILSVTGLVQTACPLYEPYWNFCRCDESDDNNEVIDLISCSEVHVYSNNTFPMLIDRNLSSSFRIIRKIQITDSDIQTIPGYTWEYVRLRSLEAIGLGIEQVDRNAFQGFISDYMENLLLGDNRISTIEPGTFRGLSQLRTLSLKGNRLGIIRDGDFSDLVSLTHLNLEQNLIGEVEERAFSSLASLEKLVIYENRLVELKANTFANLEKMSDLNIRQNRIDKLDKRLLRNLSLLTRFDASVNSITDLDSLTFENNRELRWLDLAVNELEELQDGVFYQQGELKYLDLSSNRLRTIPENLFGTNRKLETVFLDHNRIQDLPDFVFESLRFISVLHLNQNNISSITSQTFTAVSTLKKLQLQNNNLQRIPLAFDHLRELEILDLSNNDIQQVEPGSLDVLDALQTLDFSGNKLRELSSTWLGRMPNLTRLYLSRNFLHSLSPGVFLNRDSLKELDLSSNPLQFIQSSDFYGLPTLNVLYLNNTCIDSWPDGVFMPLTNLRALYLQNNPIRFVLNNTFSSLPHLTDLHLSYTGLQSVDSGAFRAENLPNLARLDLSNNQLREHLIQTFESINTTLRYLDIGNNRLNTLRSANQDLLDNLESLNVEGNPLACSCGDLQWLTPVLVEQNINMWCESPQSYHYYKPVCAALAQSCLPQDVDPSIVNCPQSVRVDETLANRTRYSRPSNVDYGICDPNRYTTRPPHQTTLEMTTMDMATVTPPSVITHVSVTSDRRFITIQWNVSEEYSDYWRAITVSVASTDPPFRRQYRLNANDSFHLLFMDGEYDTLYDICVSTEVTNSSVVTSGSRCLQIKTDERGAAASQETTPLYIPVVAATVGGAVIITTIAVVAWAVQRRKEKEKQEQKANLQDRVETWDALHGVDEDRDEAMVAQEQTTLPVDTYESTAKDSNSDKGGEGSGSDNGEELPAAGNGSVNIGYEHY